MKKIILLSVFALLIVHFTLNIKDCKAQWVQCDGVYGGWAVSIAAKENYVFASLLVYGTYLTGIYISTDCGNNWSYNTLNSRYARTLVTKGNLVFAGTYDYGVYVSSNNGQSWIQTSLSNLDVTEFEVDGNTLYAGTEAGVYSTTNDGISWISLGLQTKNITSITKCGGRIFACASTMELFLTSDNGVNWTPFHIMLPYEPQIFCLGKIGNNVVAGGEWGLYASTNFGLNWSQRYPSSHYGQVFGVKGNKIYAGFMADGIYISFDSGWTWGGTGFNGSINSIDCIAATDNYLYAGNNGNNSGVYKSTNDGNDWVMTSLNNKNVHTLSSSGSFIFAGTDDGVFVSTNYGLNFTRPGANIGQVKSLTSNQNYVFAGSYSILYRSSNNGVNWTSVLLSANEISSIIISGNNIFASSSSGMGVLKSTNNGTNWSQYGLSGKAIKSLAVGGPYLFAGVDSSGVYFTSGVSQIWLQTPLNDKAVFSLATNDSIVFAGTRNYGVYKSTNYGQNWIQTSLNNQTVRAMSISGSYVFAGTDTNGVFISTNGGIQWIRKNQGFTVSPYINTLIVSNNYLYAGTRGFSIWKRLISDIIGIENSSSIMPNDILLHQNYPNPFNPTTSIKYQVESSKFIRLVVYDILGKEVETLVNEKQAPGTYEVSWDGSNYPSGVYFYQLSIDNVQFAVKKMALIK